MAAVRDPAQPKTHLIALSTHILLGQKARAPSDWKLGAFDRGISPDNTPWKETGRTRLKLNALLEVKVLPLSVPSNGFPCARPDILGNRCRESTRGRMMFSGVEASKIRCLTFQNAMPGCAKFETCSGLHAKERQPRQRLRVSKKARNPVGVASRRIEACGGFEPIEQIVGREIVALDRLRVTIGDLDCKPSADGEARRFYGGERA